MAFWSTCSAMAVVALLFAFGNFVSVKTRAYVSSVLVAVVAFLILMYTGVIPADLTATAGLAGMVGSFVIPFCIIDVASKMKIKELRSEWKTVLTVVAATLGIVAVCVLAGVPLIGKARAVGAIAPLSGALLATTIAQQMAASMNAPEVGVFVMIVLVLQMLVALPVSTVCLKKYLAEIRRDGTLAARLSADSQPESPESSAPEKRGILATPKSWDCDYTIFFKIALIGFLGFTSGNFLAGPTRNIINATLCYLIFGMAAAELGFLERAPLEKAHSSGIIYFALFSLLLSTFASVSFETMISQMLPALAIIVLAAIGILVFAAIAGKIMKLSPWLAMSIGMCCYLGYPGSQIVVEEVLRAATDLSPEENSAAAGLMVPRMILGYFVAAVVSVISASIAVAYMF